MVIFKILSVKRRRQSEASKVNDLYRAEMLQIADYVEFLIVDVAKVPNIEATAPNLVKLLNSALHVFNESSESVSVVFFVFFWLFYVGTNPCYSYNLHYLKIMYMGKPLKHLIINELHLCTSMS